MGKSGIKAVIFDLDGTLLDTLEDLKSSLNYALKNNGFPEKTLDETRNFVGNGIDKLIERSLPSGITGETREKVRKDFLGHYSVHFADKTKPYEGVTEFLEKLKAKGIKTGVVSNKVDDAVNKLCRIYFGNHIDTAIGVAGDIPKKPMPDMLFLALRNLGCNTDTAVFVGDSEVDIQTAANARIPLISVSWGFRDKETLLRNGAVTLVSTAAELERVLNI